MNDSWPHLRGNNYNSGLYGLDTDRPEAVLDLRRRGRILSWSAPGANYELGTASSYRVLACFDRSCSRARQIGGVPRPLAAGTHQRMRLRGLPHGVDYVALRAVNAAGNLSALSDTVTAPKRGRGR
jgi:hypothetical protein